MSLTAHQSIKINLIHAIDEIQYFSCDPVTEQIIKINHLADTLEAVRLHIVLLESMSLHKKVILDTSEIDRMTTPVMQVILAASTYAKANEIEFSLMQTQNDTLKLAFEELGLENQFQTFTTH
jgi:anti-anti-sigma regulatory factor